MGRGGGPKFGSRRPRRPGGQGRGGRVSPRRLAPARPGKVEENQRAGMGRRRDSIPVRVPGELWRSRGGHDEPGGGRAAPCGEPPGSDMELGASGQSGGRAEARRGRGVAAAPAVPGRCGGVREVPALPGPAGAAGGGAGPGGPGHVVGRDGLRGAAGRGQGRAVGGPGGRRREPGGGRRGQGALVGAVVGPHGARPVPGRQRSPGPGGRGPVGGAGAAGDRAAAGDLGAAQGGRFFFFRVEDAPRWLLQDVFPRAGARLPSTDGVVWSRVDPRPCGWWPSRGACRRR